ncbi:MAG: HAMP domain-containing histidine kinase [Planctomycetes bacterium]|nr:HAMP domain-containing histidine kinase [Planctomycetota bacterium]
MSLRVRLLLVVVLLNLGVLAVVQATSYSVQRAWLEEHTRLYQDTFQSVLRDAYSAEVLEPEQRVRRLLGLAPETFRPVFRDLLITNGLAASEPGYVHLNPMGSSHRDGDTFPLRDVLGGIQESIDARTTVAAGGGYCVPILAGSEVAGGAWYVPLLPVLPPLPFAVFAVPVLVSTLLVLLLAYWSIGRAVLRPLHALGAAAGRVGSGQRGVTVPHVPGASELDGFVDAFNAMAARVEGYTDELSREVRRATEEAARKERALLASSRLAAMGTLAAGIAHEINNPIGGMLNAVHRLAEAEGLTERQRTYLRLVQDGLERVGRTARKVLDFSPRRVEARRFPLREAVDLARALVEHRSSRHRVEYRIEIPADLPELHGNPGEIQQVLLNLFLNSLDVLEGQTEPRWIAVRARPAGERIEILVEDNGPGCDRETLARVMDPFFSNKRRPDATGLGLFISYSIVRNHGGEMEVDSEPGKGFRVWIRLPAAGAGRQP